MLIILNNEFESYRTACGVFAFPVFKAGGRVPIAPAHRCSCFAVALSLKHTSLAVICMAAKVSVNLQIFPNLPDDPSPITNLSRGSVPSRKGTPPEFNKPDHKPVSTSDPSKNCRHPDDCDVSASLLDFKVEASSKV